MFTGKLPSFAICHLFYGWLRWIYHDLSSIGIAIATTSILGIHDLADYGYANAVAGDGGPIRTAQEPQKITEIIRYGKGSMPGGRASIWTLAPLWIRISILKRAGLTLDKVPQMNWTEAEVGTPPGRLKLGLHHASHAS